ncbi:DinB family protein [Hymenobacter sp. B81]|uniref:DinB family protein n=1 Tax=Hymenobacter sp. B81 TaxID=3344878 RepID=UPI0037DDA5E1
MSTETLSALFRRDLARLRREIELYRREENLWLTAGAIANPGGNLCLHLLGNLNTYIGQQLGHTGYVRNREQEFSQRHVPRAELLRRIDETSAVVATTLAELPAAALSQEYPLLVLEHKTSTEFLLTHLATHLTYHLGQLNYHRRLLDQPA